MEQTNEGQVTGIENPISTNTSTPNPTPTTSLRPIGELLSQTWILTVKKYWAVFQILLVPALLNILITIGYIVAIFGTAGIFSIIAKGDGSVLYEKLQSLVTSTAFFGSLALIIAAGLIMSIVLYVSQIWSYAAIITEVSNIDSKGLLANYQSSWKKLFQYWWIGFIVGAIVLGGSILLIIPGIIFAIWFNYAEFILFIEDVKGAEAVARSKKYVEGKWWDVFVRMFLLIISVVVVFLVISFIIGIIFGSLVKIAGDNIIILLILNIIERIIIFALTALIMTFGYNYQFLIYQNLKEIKGQMDETKISNTSKWIYNGVAIGLAVFLLLIIIFSSYAILTLVRNIPNYSSQLDSLKTIEETMKENNNEFDLSSTSAPEENILSGVKNATDRELDAKALSLQTALDTFYTTKGFYPYTEKIDALWTGDDRVLDKKMEMEQCGEINVPTSKCGIYYRWIDKDNYQIIVTHTDGEQNIITNLESDNIDQTKPAIS